MNIGPATNHDLMSLGIHSIKELVATNTDSLFIQLHRITGHHYDTCIWDIFVALFMRLVQE